MINDFICHVDRKKYSSKKLELLLLLKLNKEIFFHIRLCGCIMYMITMLIFVRQTHDYFSFSIQPWDLSISNYSTTISLENQLRSRYAMQLWNLNCSTNSAVELLGNFHNWLILFEPKYFGFLTTFFLVFLKKVR